MTASKEDIFFAREPVILLSLGNNLEWLPSAPLTHKMDAI